ncbi:MAG TPA: hypothetical protein VJB57_13655 [Dehalococcoidia bacterium]|nr:hypothetical protein [Dehalococcoidia bacterium]
MRIGFFFGFLIGALVASIVGDKESEGGTAAVAVPPEQEPQGLIEKLKLQARKAQATAKEAAAAKEAEMLREFEAAKQGHRP